MPIMTETITSQYSSRNVAFDFVKAFAIWLVVYGHCEQYLLTLDRIDNPVYQFIYTFHMPLFMMVSGYFSVSSLKQDVVPFLLKKSRTLLLPVVTFTSSLILYYALIGSLGDFGFRNTAALFIRWCCFSLWFLKSLFLCYLFLYFSRYLSGKYQTLYFLITLVISQLITDLNFPIMYPVFLIGYGLRKLNLLAFISTNRLIPVCLVVLFLSMSLPYCADLECDSLFGGVIHFGPKNCSVSIA